jgi:hypothetical protein
VFTTTLTLRLEEIAIKLVTESAMSHVHAEMERLVQDAVGYASASASITAAEALHIHGGGRGGYGYAGHGHAGYGYSESLSSRLDSARWSISQRAPSTWMGSPERFLFTTQKMVTIFFSTFRCIYIC